MATGKRISRPARAPHANVGTAIVASASPRIRLSIAVQAAITVSVTE